jgi:hypothetical protein
MKRLLGLTTALIAVWALVPASASALIQLDRGIAGARLGNTKQQVRAALGTPKTVRNGTNEFGAFTVFRYAGGIRVTFQGQQTVTAVQTTGLGDRTARGVGVRSTESAVKNRVPGVSCQTFEGTRICQRGEGLPGQRITAFFLKNGRVTRVIVGRVID